MSDEQPPELTPEQIEEARLAKLREGIVEFTATHEVLIPDPGIGWSVWTHGFTPRPVWPSSIVMVKHPHNRCVIEDDQRTDDKIAVRFLTPHQHIEAYPKEWVKSL